MRDQGMCVRACVLVLPAHSVIAVWSAWRGTFMALELHCLVDENLLSAKLTKHLLRATYRTEKWEHPFGPRRPLWS